MNQRNWDAWQISAGFILAVCLGLYLGVPSVQKFVDGAWQTIAGKTRTTWVDFKQVVDTPSVAERIAMEQVRIKRACTQGDTKACQYLRAVEAEGRR